MFIYIIYNREEKMIGDMNEAADVIVATPLMNLPIEQPKKRSDQNQEVHLEITVARIHPYMIYTCKFFPVFLFLIFPQINLL